MFNYAQLNEKDIVIGISHLKGEVHADNMILINDFEVVIGSIYNRSTREFTPPILQPGPMETPSIEEQILAEAQYQTALLEVNTLGGNV
ncbi:hypothetical protein [Lysinibacillus sp. 3P01SB]|uniref:hypothetical protein n=1 Tax=Lysinibacillus sp. 3P01SB TaxID=3132284 RepID=UPI0039A5545D